VKRRTLLHVARATAAAGLALAVLGTPAAMATVNLPTNTTVTAAPSSVSTGAPVVYTATISPPQSSGNVTFFQDSQPIAGCGSLSLATSAATCATTASSVPALHNIYASYSGTTGYFASGGFVFLPVIGATKTVVTASPKLADPGAAMTYVATVTPRPTSILITNCLGGCGPVETVDFSVDGTPVADCLQRPVNRETGIATCKTAVAPAAGGKHVVTASYVGSEDTYLLASTGTDDFDVTAPVVSLSTGAVSFGSVTVGASGTQTVTVTNTGNAALHLADATAGGAFTIVANTCAGATLTPAATCVITVAFAPTAAGNAAATLTVSSDAGAATAALTGTGAAVAAPPTPPTGASLPPNSKTTFTATTSDAPGAPTSVTIPLRCPTGVACTLDGTVVISTDDLIKSKTVRAAALDTQTVARFAGVRVAAGKVKQIKLKLSPSFIKSAQKRGIRFIHAVLTVNTSFTDGSKATRQEKVTIRIPKPAVKKKAVVKQAPHFTG
jgi:hypothetical protein